MTASAIRITAVPRSDHPTSGLQAMFFANHYGDTVWALPAPGSYTGDYQRVSFFFMDRDGLKRVLPLRLIRLAYLLSIFLRAAFLPGRLFIVHSFIFAIPLWLLRRRYCIFVHGTDRRFLDQRWAQAVVRSALAVFGVGFGLHSKKGVVQEAPNIFIPTVCSPQPSIEHDILFVLRNARVKNPLFPIALAEKVGAGLGLRVATVGVAPGELSPSDQLRLRRLQEADLDVRYFGRRSYEDVVKLMGSSRILMIPSYSEGLPKVLFEGMFQGMHVIVNRTLEFPKEILRRVNRVDLDNWDEITAIITTLLAKERSTANFSFAKQYLAESQKSLISLYDDIYSRHSPAFSSGAKKSRSSCK